MTKFAKENPAISKVHTPAIAELTALNTSHMLTMNNLKGRHMLMNKLERNKKGCNVGDEQPERNNKRCILVMNNLKGRRKATV